METIKLRAHVGHDSVLKIEVPTGLQNMDVDVVLVLQPEQPILGYDREAWMKFIHETAGSLADNPIERGDQGTYSIRDTILDDVP